MNMRLYTIEDDAAAAAFEKWAEENHIAFKELDERNYVDTCPECGDQEFWHGGRCGHCGFTL